MLLSLTVGVLNLVAHKAEEISRVFPMSRSLRDEGKMPAHLLPASWAKVLLRVVKRGRRGLEIGTGGLGQGSGREIVSGAQVGVQIRVKGLGQSLRSGYQIRRLG